MNETHQENKNPLRLRIFFYGIKDALFQLFLFFYFSQILGLSGTYTGLATIALFFDAITDPWVVHYQTDGNQKNMAEDTFMYLAALPLGLSLFLLFTPPAGLVEFELFLWLCFFSALVRVALLFSCSGNVTRCRTFR